MSALSAALIRRRRIVLAAAVAVAVAYPGSRWLTAPRDALLLALLYDGLVVAVLVAVLLTLATTGRKRPPTLVVRPDVPSFESPLSLPSVALALAVTLLTGGQAGSLFDRNKPLDLQIIAVALTVLLAAVATLCLVVAWQGLRTRLGPDGLWWRTPAQSVVVPWAALSPGGPPRPKLSDTSLRLAYAHPELVQRRGPAWRLDRFPVGWVHPWFLSDVIRHYVAHPEHRAAIGTETEYHRLCTALRDEASRTHQGRSLS
ncbi:hypothetical protein OG799_13175 [Micromonospora sp. NBC_00898]|uniref:hypothetical protein n=1 Tax=Micromonospora sp. NBC_00898 TaxID=2975981 RepID=UPI00386FFB76|nr:hypothetical protein OG799_13175 [Micromonospora sp. NBC_00898]